MPTREELLAETFLLLADTLVDDFDPIEVLTVLAERCVELLGATAAGIMIADSHGALQVVADSSEQAHFLELFQIQNEEGPCRDSFRHGEPVVHADLRTAHAATITLLQHRSTHHSQEVTAQLQGALNSRVAVEQAKGALAERAEISVDEAFVRLRAYARTNNVKLTEVATSLVSRSLPPAAVAMLTQTRSAPVATA